MNPVDPACTVSVPISDISVTKSVNPASGTTVSPGQVLTYSLTFKNSGQTAGTVDYTDDLTGVLDDATLTGAPAASNPALTVSAVDPSTNRFRVTGTVPANTTYTVTNEVTVTPYDREGNHSLDNFLVATGTTPPSTCVSTNPLCTHNPVSTPGHGVGGHGIGGKVSSPAGLAFTGGDWLAYGILGGLLLASGALVVLLVRRPRGTI